MIDKIVGPLAGGLVAELRANPWTVLTASAALGLAVWVNLQAAKADDVAQISIQLIEIRASQIEDKMLNARARFCKAADDEQKHYFDHLTREYKNQYRQVTGRDYILPSCAEV